MRGERAFRPEGLRDVRLRGLELARRVLRLVARDAPEAPEDPAYLTTW
jgi:hypothetical protein